MYCLSCGDVFFFAETEDEKFCNVCNKRHKERDEKKIKKEIKDTATSPSKVTNKQDEILLDLYQICLGIKSNKKEYKNIYKAYSVIGAAIFYGPKNTKLQLKGQSIQSIETGEKVADHVYSRNRSGKYFMENNFNSFKEFKKWYWEKASIFVYVTKKENADLKPFQKEGYEDTWQETYKKAGIKFKEF